MSSSWELVRQLLWLPFDIMTRISRQFLLLGRNVYGSLFGTKPAIKPPPSLPLSESSSTSPKSSSPIPPSSLQSSPAIPASSPQSSSPIPPSYFLRGGDPDISKSATLPNTVQSCVIDITGAVSSDLGALIASPSTSIAMDDLEPALSEDRMMMATSSSISISAQQQLEIGGMTSCGSAAADGSLTRHAKEEGAPVHADIINESASPSSTIPSKKRFRGREKRKKVTGTAHGSDQDDGGIGEPAKVEQFVSSSGSVSSVVISPEAKKPKLSEEEPSSSVSSSVVATTRDNNPPKIKKKRGKKKNNPQGEQIGNQDEGGKMGRSPPPNFFIAVQISNQEIISRAENLQKSLSEKTTPAVFRDAMVPVKKLHFTLHVMHLNGPQEIERAQSAFEECCKEIAHEFQDNPLDLTIEGLGHFKHSVIFAQIKEKDEVQIKRLTELANHFKTKFGEIDIPGDSRPFKAHLTIAKISRSKKLYNMKIRNFPSDMMSGLEGTHFGTQRVNGVQLLYMAGEDRETGYYRLLAQHDFYNSFETNPTPVPLTILNAATTSNMDNSKKLSSETKVPEPNKIIT